MVVSEKINYCSQCGIRFSDYLKDSPHFCPCCGAEIKYKSRKNEERQCSICHHKVRMNDIVSCSFCENIFHYTCIANWLRRQNICPVCLNKYVFPQQTYK